MCWYAERVAEETKHLQNSEMSGRNDHIVKVI